MAGITRNQIISIHCCKKEAGLDTDEKYRAFLLKVAGVNSCKELTQDGANRVLQAMGRNVKPREVVVKKPIITFPSRIQPRVWTTREVTDAEWSTFAQQMSTLEKQGIVLVAKWDASGKKFFRTRAI
jgi:phage gp16-like protein